MNIRICYINPPSAMLKIVDYYVIFYSYCHSHHLLMEFLHHLLKSLYITHRPLCHHINQVFIGIMIGDRYNQLYVIMNIFSQTIKGAKCMASSSYLNLCLSFTIPGHSFSKSYKSFASCCIITCPGKHSLNIFTKPTLNTFCGTS